MRRIIEAHQAATEGVVPVAVVRPRNYDQVIELVADRVKSTSGRVSAKRLLPAARAAGYAGSDRNFRRLVATVKKQWRHDQARAGGRRPAVWSPGEVLAIDWGEEVLAGRKLLVFCAVLGWSRFRFVRFATDQQLATTLGIARRSDDVRVPKQDFSGELWAGMIDPPRIFAEYIERHAKSPETAQRLFANKLYQQMSTTLSGSPISSV